MRICYIVLGKIRDSTLVSQAQFEQDMLDVYARMRKSGIDVSRSNLFIPPYEYYNEKISAWARGLGLRLVNFTPGTWTNADYTTPDMKNYRSSESIYDRRRSKNAMVEWSYYVVSF